MKVNLKSCRRTLQDRIAKYTFQPVENGEAMQARYCSRITS